MRADHCPSLVKTCLKRNHSSETHNLPRPVARTDPYQAPYFFPSPMSPDAPGYSSRIRAGRVSSPQAEVKSHPTPTVVVANSLPGSTRPQQGVASSDRQFTSPSSQPERAKIKSRRSWHFPFRHDEMERPVSWTSDAATLVSGLPSPRGLSNHPSSPELKRKKSVRSRYVCQLLPITSAPYLSCRLSSRKSVPSFAPLDLETPPATGHGIVNPPLSSPTPSGNLASKSSWRLAFGPRRSSSRTHGSSRSQLLSDHAVDELSEPRLRPRLRRTT